MKNVSFSGGGRETKGAVDAEHLVDGKYSIKDLVDINRLRTLFEDFSKTTGFTTGFLSYPGLEILIATGWRDACTKYHRACPASMEACKESNIYLTHCLKNLKELSIKPCGNGLVDGATPVIIRGKHLACVSTGQVLLEPPDWAYFEMQAIKYGYDVKLYLAAIKELPVVTEKQLKQALRYLGNLTAFIAEEGLNALYVRMSAELIREENKRRKKSEQALRKSEARYQALVEQAPDGLFVIDSQGGRFGFIDVNSATCQMFGYSREELLRLSISDVVMTEETLRASSEMTIAKSGESVFTQWQLLRKDGSVFFGEVRAREISEGRIQGFIRDITECKRLEREVLEIGGHEVRRIGQELHDDICQWLAGTSMLAAALAKDLAKESPANAPRAQEIEDYTKHTLEALRRVTHGLVPAVFDEGLVGALRELAANVEEILNIRCRCEFRYEVRVRDQNTILHLYRIAQEAISNAVRHGGAKEVTLLLLPNKDRFSMMIRDDGCGISQPLPQTSGMGLRTMRYRAGSIGATLEICPGAKGGTEVVCTIPLKPEECPLNGLA